MYSKLTAALILFFLQAGILCSQEPVTMVGTIYDQESKTPLPYVNIGFLRESVGTVSDENGKFELTFNPGEISNASILQISYIGFKSLKLLATDFYASMAKDNKFYLLPEPFGLEEVVLTNDLRKERGIGSLTLNPNTAGYWLNPEALGGEISMRIPIESKNTKLHDLNFQVVKNNSGRIKVRVNVYEYNKGWPGRNLLSQNIHHTIEIGSGIVTINLEPYNIFVDDDVVVSLELIQVYGRSIDFEIGGSDYKTYSFTRLFNQDEWKRVEQGMAIKVRTSFPSLNGKIIATTRIAPKKILLYWDASLKMQDEKRDLKKELRLLERYLQALVNVDVKIIKFSALTMDQHEFYLTQGNTDGIIEYLQNTEYEGEPSFSNVLKSNDFEADVALLFSRATTLLEPLEQSTYLPAFCINSNPVADHDKLRTASLYGDGQYIDLDKVSIRDGLEMMLTQYRGDEISYEEAERDLGSIKGRIISDSLVIPRASIRVKNTLKETQSDTQGYFTIDAAAGDVLAIQALGMEDREIPFSNAPDLEINLKPNTTLLDEVILYGRTREKSATVLTASGERNIDAIGFGVNTLTEDDISPVHTTLDDVLSKVPGLQISGVGANKRYSFSINVMSSTGLHVDPNPAIVIDDIVYSQKDGLEQLPPIDVQSIKSVRAIKSLAGTNRYGSAGAYGVIEIRTWASSPEKPGSSRKKEDAALAKGNDYEDEGIPLWDDAIALPDYIRELEKATSFEEAKSIYKKQKETLTPTIPYILNVSHYFKKWNPDYAFIVMTNIAAIADKNVKALKTLAFQLEESQRHETAKLIYQRIAQLRPEDAQSHRDLALAHTATGHYKEAMALYRQMIGNAIEGVDFSGLQLPIIDELRHLLAHHRGRVDFKGLPTEFLATGFEQDLRIIFEWNDPAAEFVLQFVNPQKKFYKWAHTPLDQPERLFDEIKKGYATEAYIIDDVGEGEWIVNLESFKGGASPNPDYLKYTVYRNYGLATETKTVRVIPLRDLTGKVTLDRFIFP